MRNNIQWTPPPPLFQLSIMQLVAARAIRIDDRANPHRAELLAAKEGLIFAWDAGFHHAIMEGDAHNVYESIEYAAKDLSYNASIIRDIVMFASWFSSFKCGFIVREYNKVADYLAHRAIRRVLVCG